MRSSALKTLRFLELKEGQSCLLCLSPKYIAGMMMLVRWMEGDLDLYFTEPSSTPLRQIEPKIDFVAMVPYQVFHSLEQLDRVKTLLIGGGAIEPSLQGSVRNTNCRVFQSYGMTETITHIALREINQHLQHVYRLLPGVKVRLDERSCLVIDAPDIGVQNLVTNDVAELISDSEFRWIGRYDNVVNSGGIKIFPEELEAQIGDIGFNYVIGGIPDPALGEQLVMVIEADSSEIVPKLLNKLESLPRYHRPREVRLLREFARTNTGKLKRSEILKEAFGDS